MFNNIICYFPSNGKGTCMKDRSRYCNNPPPAHGGANCEGADQSSEPCTEVDLINPDNNPDCVILGGWSDWGPPTECSADCSSTRTRSCTNPSPYNARVRTNNSKDILGLVD